MRESGDVAELQAGRVPIRSPQGSPLHAGAARKAGLSRFCVLDIEPELAEGVDAGELPLARSAATAIAWLLPRGQWRSEPWMFAERESLGLLVLDGLITRHLAIGEMEAVELVGPGDVLRPWVGLNGELSNHVREHWMTTRRTRLANLDGSFAAAVSRWPTIAAKINDRVARRVDWIALASAVHGMRRTEDRLLTMLWFYADRWGRVTPDGVVLELELTHSLLAAVIGARRPSVTTSLKALEAAGMLLRRSDHSWVLLGGRPAVLACTGDEALEPATDSFAYLAQE
jgi:CRP/FNR family transcriptional regulator, cyclic AMP receptor protein